MLVKPVGLLGACLCSFVVDGKNKDVCGKLVVTFTGEGSGLVLEIIGDWYGVP